MTTTVFTPGTKVASSWLNDVDATAYDGVINVKHAAYGAVGDGSTDDTNAIKAAVAAAGDYGTIYFPSGTYKVTSRIDVPYSYHTWYGDGRGSTFIKFAPTADGVCVRLGTSANLTNQQLISGMTFTSADSTYAKVAIQTYDTSATTIRDVAITGTVLAGGTYAWCGGVGGSIGIHTKGREALTVDTCYISANNPVFIDTNIRSTGAVQVDSDFTALRNVYMIAYNYPNVLIDDAVDLSNFSMIDCPMVRGTYAVYWVGTAATRATSGFVIRSSRWEQAETSGYFGIEVRPYTNLYGFEIDGLQLPGTESGVNPAGIKIAKMINPVLKSIISNQTTGTVLDVASTVVGLRWENCFWGTSTTVTLTGQKQIWAMPRVLATDPLPRTAQYDQDTNTRNGLKFAGGLEGWGVSLADDASVTIGTSSTRGFVDIVSSESVGATYFLPGGGATIEVSDPAGTFVNSDTDTLNCVFWDGSAYKLRNRRGSTFIYYVILRGSQASLEV